MKKRRDEFKDIKDAIEKWFRKKRGNVSFVGGFVSFDDKFDVKGDVMIGYGPKETVKIMLQALNQELKKEKKDFVDW